MHLAEEGGESEILEVNSSLERLSTVDSDRDSSDDLGLLSRLPPGSLGVHESVDKRNLDDDLGLLSRLPPGSLGFHESSVSKEKKTCTVGLQVVLRIWDINNK